MDFEPLVSIVMPVYNGSNFMREAIDSALAQTYKNIEVIVVNDGSTDNTEEIAKSYKDKIRYFKKENGGVSTALNLAIENSKGEYISWLSHDDVYYPNKIENQIEELNKLDDKNTILYSDWSVIDDKSVVIGKTNFSSVFLIHKLNYPLFPIFKGIIHGCSLLIHKECFNETSLFDVNLKTTQDYKLWFEMFPKYSIRFMPEYLVKSRTHNNQGSKSIDNAKNENDALWIYMLENLSEENMLLFDGSILKFYTSTVNILKNANYLKAYDYLQKKIDIYKKNIKKNYQIKVSVVCPFYNRINYVIEAIESVIKQTYSNWELLLVDDISTDNIYDIENYIKKDNRIKLLRNKYKKGTSGARNTGIENATGDYIAFLDSDDLFLPEKLEKQLNFMIDSDSMISHTSYETFYDLGNIETLNTGKDIIFPDIMFSCPIATPTVMINSKILQNKNFRFIEKYLYGEDNCLWILIAKTYTINGLNEVLTKVHKDNNSTTNNKIKYLKGLSNIFSFLITEENINYYNSYLYSFLKHFDNIFLDQINIINEKNNKTTKLFDIKILKIEQNNKFIVFTFLFFIKLSIKINAIAWWIPVRKWRDNFRKKFEL